jgi:hypothetical protein
VVGFPFIDMVLRWSRERKQEAKILGPAPKIDEVKYEHGSVPRQRRYDYKNDENAANHTYICERWEQKWSQKNLVYKEAEIDSILQGGKQRQITRKM